MAELNLELTSALANDIYEKWYKKFVEKGQERNETEGHLFNVFALWNRLSGIGETLHSRLLHFLLSDDPMHGQKNKFLMKFLEMAGIENPQEGTWYATAETGRVDVMLKRTNPHSVIIIENKSNWAGDQNNQLYRSSMKTCTPKNRRHMTIPITKSSIFHRVQIKNSTVRAAANRRKSGSSNGESNAITTNYPAKSR